MMIKKAILYVNVFYLSISEAMKDILLKWVTQWID